MRVQDQTYMRLWVSSMLLSIVVVQVFLLWSLFMTHVIQQISAKVASYLGDGLCKAPARDHPEELSAGLQHPHRSAEAQHSKQA